jgi:hypothetical protein
MKTFKIDYVEGASQGINPISFMGIHRDLSLQATDKAEAYVHFYNHFTKQGKDVSILLRSEHRGGVEFSEQELARLQEARIPLNTEYPRLGVEIQAITEVS